MKANRLFISHSSLDKDLAQALVDLICEALVLPRPDILCSSVEGTKLKGGDDTDDVLRQQITQVPAFISILTRKAVASTYVLFELGARWGCKKHHIPLLAKGAGQEVLKGPLRKNALNLSVESDVLQLLQDLAGVLKREPQPPNGYLMKVHKVVGLATRAEVGFKAPMPHLEPAQSLTQPGGCKLEVTLKNGKTVSRSVPGHIAFEIVKQISRRESSGWQPEAKLPTSLGDMLALKEKRPELFELISEQSFMRAIAEAFTAQRFDVRYRRDSQEFGFDFLIRDRSRQCMVVQIKKNNLNSTISISTVQRLLGAAQTFEDTAALLICTSGFSDSARGFAS